MYNRSQKNHTNTRIENAMILAAGLGKRMRPLTKDRPKAMVEMNGRPLIDYILENLLAAGVKQVVINLHHAPDKLVNHLENLQSRLKIHLSPENDNLLDTGGGVKHALPLLEKEPFFVTNCDSFFPQNKENPFSLLFEGWKEGTMDGLLLLVKKENAGGYHGKGDFLLEKDGRLKRRGEKSGAPFVFTGVQILRPEIFMGEKETVFSLNRIYDRALKKGSLFGKTYNRPWFHVGTPMEIELLENFLKSREGTQRP